MRQKSPGNSGVYGFLETVINFGLKVGGALFVIISAWLIWGMTRGALSGTEVLSNADFSRILSNVIKASDLLAICGVVVIASAAAKYYREEVTGFVLVLYGAALHWGIPYAAVDTPKQLQPIIGYIVSQYGVVGTVALIVAIPFIIANLWSMIKVERLSTDKSKCAGKDKTSEDMPKESKLYFYCWQTPFCRDYMKVFCDAYKKKKPCWNIRSGCYCDEEMILKALKGKDDKKSSGFEKAFDLYKAPTRNLTWYQKWARCSKCDMYLEHQKQKYQAASVFGFVIPIALIWSYYDVIKKMLHSALIYTDKFSNQFSIGLPTQKASSSGLNELIGSSGTVEFIFIVCAGLALITLMLKAIEYLIFKLGL